MDDGEVMAERIVHRREITKENNLGVKAPIQKISYRGVHPTPSFSRAPSGTIFLSPDDGGGSALPPPEGCSCLPCPTWSWKKKLFGRYPARHPAHPTVLRFASGCSKRLPM